MTSNIGSHEILDGHPEMVNQLLRTKFKPEFLNRIDEIIYFNSLGREVQFKIVDKMLNNLKERLKSQYFLVDFSENLKKHIIEESYDEAYGARPIRRFIQNNIETFIAMSILGGKVKIETPYILDFDKELKFIAK
ncbi:MAG: ATP-dependent Clp protease ATP-binding subunit [Candidatus Gastranaerophilales bacterium]|nr:ATP-dependent Clp protease ATP-binding subunit [Candidatus Gastranaerophilales bacterium]